MGRNPQPLIDTSCGMKYPPGREDFLNPLTQTGILFLMPLLPSNYAPYFPTLSESHPHS